MNLLLGMLNTAFTWFRAIGVLPLPSERKRGLWKLPDKAHGLGSNQRRNAWTISTPNAKDMASELSSIILRGAKRRKDQGSRFKFSTDSIPKRDSLRLCREACQFFLSTIRYTTRSGQKRP
jgi:hypothetical protein